MRITLRALPELGALQAMAEDAMGFSKILQLPYSLILAPAANQSYEVLVPKAGSPAPKVGLSNFIAEDCKYEIQRVHMENMRVRINGENGTKKNAFKLGGAFTDFLVKMPPAFQSGWSMTLAEAHARIAESGDVSVNLGSDGFQMREVPKPDESQGGLVLGLKAREGSPSDLDGPLPEQFQRTTQKIFVVDRTVVLPMVDLSNNFESKNEGALLKTTLDAQQQGKVNVTGILRTVLAKRPTQDFGYVFHTAKLNRRINNPEPGLDNTQTVAVVSCGFLRLYRPDRKAAKNPFAVIDFTPDNGQLELDLTKYTDAPVVEQDEEQSTDRCLVLYSSGYAKRKRYAGMFSARQEVEERLCGTEEQVLELQAAIGLQVKRFTSDAQKSREWNFGTHEAGGEIQYQLHPGLETAGLQELIMAA